MKPIFLTVLTVWLSASPLSFAMGKRPSPPPAAPKLFHSSFNINVPAASPDCASDASNLAAQIAKADPDVKGVQVACIARGTLTEAGQNYEIDTFSIDYDAPLFFSPYTIELTTQDFGDLALYPTYASCLKDLPAQKALFTKMTGLSPLVSTCLAESSPDFGFRLRITSFGTPQKILFRYVNNAFVKSQADPQWKTEIEKMISSLGGVLAKETSETYYYYADTTEGSIFWTSIDTKTPQECDLQRDEAATVLVRSGARHFSVSCHATDYATTLDLLSDYSASFRPLSKFDGQIYFSFDQCMQARAAVEQKYRENSGFLGFFCSPDWINPTHYTIIAIAQ